MKKISLPIILLSLLVLTSACGKIGRKRNMPGPNDRVYTVSSSSVISREIPDIIEIKGIFSPSQKLTIKSEFTGKIQALSVNEGQNIATGEAILKIEDEKLPYVLERQRAELREAEAAMELGGRGSEGGGSNEDAFEEPQPPAQDNQVAANTEDNAPNVANNEARGPEGSPYPDQGQAPDNADNTSPLEKRLAIVRSQMANRAAQRRNLPPAPVQVPVPVQRAPVSPEQAENRAAFDQAKIDRIKAEIALSEKQQSSGTLQAPIDGFVSKVYVTEGALVQINDPLVDIVDIDPIELILQVPKDQVSAINKSLEVKVTSPDLPGQIFQGEISFIGAELEAQKKTLEVRIRINNPELKIKASMDGTAQLAEAKRNHQGLTIPPEAIRTLDGKKYVYILHGQSAEKQEVETGGLVEGMIEIKDGLSKSDLVVTTGVDQLKENEEFIRQVR
jgi:RND family efflux transporter MFP subunit